MGCVGCDAPKRRQPNPKCKLVNFVIINRNDKHHNSFTLLHFRCCARRQHRQPRYRRNGSVKRGSAFISSPSHSLIPFQMRTKRPSILNEQQCRPNGIKCVRLPCARAQTLTLCLFIRGPAWMGMGRMKCISSIYVNLMAEQVHYAEQQHHNIVTFNVTA